MILFFLSALIISNAQVKNGVSVPVYLDINSKNSVPKNGVLRGNVSVDKDLPEEFYGTWAVKGTITETNNPELFRNKSADIWVFDKSGTIITLSNPVTGATASITVNEVVGKKAKFTREKVKKNYIETETPEVTIEGDNFFGEDTLIIKYLFREKIYKTDVVKYKLEGRKISGPTLKDLFAK